MNNTFPVTFDGPTTLRTVEATLVRATLDFCDGNMLHAARALGISRSAMYSKCHRHGIPTARARVAQPLPQDPQGAPPPSDPCAPGAP